MWFWIITKIAGGIIASASSSWFAKTPAGQWFFKKTEELYNWAAERYGFKVLKTEDKWKKKYPNVAKKVDALESSIDEVKKSQTVLTGLIQEMNQSQSGVVEKSAKEISDAIEKFESTNKKTRLRDSQN